MQEKQCVLLQSFTEIMQTPILQLAKIVFFLAYYVKLCQMHWGPLRIEALQIALAFLRRQQIVLRIRDVYPGSELFPSRIPDPGSKRLRIPDPHQRI
jgi:hypothetical protein